MTEFLNLDEVVEDTKTVILNGKSYKLRSATVEEFLEQVKHAKELQDKGEMVPGKAIDLLIQRLVKYMDGVTYEELAQLNFKQLNALMAFSSGEDEAKRMAKEQEEKEAPKSSRG